MRVKGSITLLYCLVINKFAHGFVKQPTSIAANNNRTTKLHLQIPNIPSSIALPQIHSPDVATLFSDLNIETIKGFLAVDGLMIVGGGALFASLALILYQLSFPDDNFRRGYEPYPRAGYDPSVAKAYYAQHPFLVLRRSLQLLRFSNGFIFNILFDKYILRDEEKYRSERAQELLALIQKAGPTAIKVGQALSVRPDLIPAEYSSALSTLQDRVPPFPSEEAKDLLRSELGSSTILKLSNLNMDKPVAAASIGQVYKATATLKDGTVKDVALKVQRPNSLAEIALDLHIVREFAPIYQKLTRSATDYRLLANEWGRGFIAELAYSEEAANTKKFNRDMESRGLTAVSAPIVIDELSTDRILTTEWVDGTRLDKSTANDVPRLCSVALNAYLVMLLETGCLHCDPHPGNLLRTNDGKLCILDFGMTLQTDPDLQYSLLEFVAHLTAEQFDEVPYDLVKLGFLKKDRLDTVRASGVLEPLTYILKQAGQGGGGKKVRERIFTEYREKYPGLDDDELRYRMRDDMQAQIEAARKKESVSSGITMEVEELQKRNKDAFSIPEWFVYTSRAFLTLEGICLQADEDYSIIKSCFPYVAKRLLKDGSPRAEEALRKIVYGGNSSNAGINPGKLTDLADGFTSYTTSTKMLNVENINNGKHDTLASKRSSSTIEETEAAMTLVKDGAEILLNPEGSFLQNLLIGESTAAVSASFKDAIKNALIDQPNIIRSNLPFNLGQLLPKPRAKELEPFIRKSIDEENAQALLTKLVSAALNSDNNDSAANGRVNETRSTSTQANNNTELDPEQVALIARELRNNLPTYAPLVGQLGEKFVSKLLERSSNNIQLALTEVEGQSQDAVGSAIISSAKVIKDGASFAQEAIASQRQQSRS